MAECAAPAVCVARAAEAQRSWARRAIDDRLEVLRRFRQTIGRDPDPLLRTLAERPNRNAADALLAEVLPLADACRFLEREAETLLMPRRLGLRGRPLWLTGVKAEIRREPWGLVLVIGPGNYPLLLTALPAVQALAAGNAVLVKPAPGCEATARVFCDGLSRAGLPPGLCQALPADIEAVEASVEAGIDHVVLTGSAMTGRALLARLAPRLIPATLELSGSDAVFVLPGADLDMVSRALVYGLRLNGSATCIAPRRIFAIPEQARQLERLLAPRLAAVPPAEIPPGVRAQAMDLLEEARAGGGRMIPADPIVGTGGWRAVVVADASPEWALLRADVFAPIAAMVRVEHMDEALALDARCPYALGASVFGPHAEASALAARVRAGSVTINDLIVPTADPRLPFGGRHESGYGVTRGAEGLLAMTTVKTVSSRRGSARPHYDEPQEHLEEVARAWLASAHGGGLAHRMSAMANLLRKLAQLSRSSAS